MHRNVGTGFTKPHKSLKLNDSTYARMRKVELRGRPIEYSEHFIRCVFACRRYINKGIKGIVGSRDTLAKILQIEDK